MRRSEDNVPRSMSSVGLSAACKRNTSSDSILCAVCVVQERSGYVMGSVSNVINFPCCVCNGNADTGVKNGKY